MMAKEVAKKRNVRAAQRSVITKTIRQVKGLLGDPEVDKAKLRHKRLILVEKLDILT